MGGYKCELSPELQEIARKTLHENPERREADIQHIRDWLKKQPHLISRTGNIDLNSRIQDYLRSKRLNKYRNLH